MHAPGEYGKIALSRRLLRRWNMAPSKNGCSMMEKGERMDTILLLEDDEAMCRGIALALADPRRKVVSAGTLKEGREILAAGDFRLAVLDVNLPDGSGLELLQESKGLRPDLPVILLTANDMEIDQVTGLEAGADDYITKPFSLAVLRARVNAQLRRRDSDRREVWEAGPFRFDFARMDYRREGRPVDLSKTEQRLLRALVENQGHVVPREALLDRVWTEGAEFVEENALSVTVKRLRDKLEENPSQPQWLRTVYGIGYVWGALLWEGSK